MRPPERGYDETVVERILRAASLKVPAQAGHSQAGQLNDAQRQGEGYRLAQLAWGAVGETVLIIRTPRDTIGGIILVSVCEAEVVRSFPVKTT